MPSDSTRLVGRRFSVLSCVESATADGHSVAQRSCCLPAAEPSGAAARLGDTLDWSTTRREEVVCVGLCTVDREDLVEKVQDLRGDTWSIDPQVNSLKTVASAVKYQRE